MHPASAVYSSASNLRASLAWTVNVPSTGVQPSDAASSLPESPQADRVRASAAAPVRERRVRRMVRHAGRATPGRFQSPPPPERAAGYALAMAADLSTLLDPGYLGDLPNRPMPEVRAMRAECQEVES